MSSPPSSATILPKEGYVILVVTHLVKPDEKGDGYQKTAAATLVIDVPQRCPCCD